MFRQSQDIYMRVITRGLLKSNLWKWYSVMGLKLVTVSAERKIDANNKNFNICGLIHMGGCVYGANK